ncbi:transport and Golgi organization protein 1 homolog isoform X4 [Salvelinus fontinalis]|uniref:transport and Golgi organization protein 1 homolog isoform X4 n=1 Tax=Salvelinus fontinalis TaxID=8038 RepID=UPI002485B6ED|nr:transport and Golgi organization protein 1 homolog isoform X4 [Salvelinus fontinalis]
MTGLSRVDMAASQKYIWTFTIFIFPILTWGLLSDFKICGDSECESLLSRVRATRDHRGKDCRFLNFKKGDVIFVYHKLSGKRDDLWAGSIDRQFGYFPKDAVKVDEIYANTEKEVATQKQDFFCIDEYGSLIDNDSSEWDNEENLVSEFQEIAANDAQDSKTSKDAFLSQSFAQSSDETGNKDANQAVMEYFSDDTKPAPSEQGGSQWIGSTVTGWLSLGGERPDDNPKEDNPEQESFRSRKLALDIDANQLKEETKNTENSGWFGDGLTSAFGFGHKAPEEEKPIEKEVEEQPPPSKSWLNIGIRDVLHFGQSNQDKVEERIEAAGRDESTGTIDPQDVGTSQSHHDATVEQIKETEHQRDDNTGKKAERTETHPSKPVKDYNQEDRHSQEEDGELRKEKDAGWYGSIYNNIVGLYGEQSDVEEEEDILIAEDEEDKDINLQSETESQSVFSSMFDTLVSPFQADTTNNYKNAQSDEVTDIKPAEADGDTEISLTCQMAIPYDSTEASVGRKDDNDGNDSNKALHPPRLEIDKVQSANKILETSKYMSLSHDPQLQDTTGIVNLEVDPEKAIAEMKVVDQKEFPPSDHSKEWHVETDPIDNIGFINIILDPVLDSTILNADTTSNNLLSDKGNDDGEGYIVDKASEIEKAEGIEPKKIVEVERDHGDEATFSTHVFEYTQSSSGPNAKIEMYRDTSDLVPPETVTGNEQRQTEVLDKADTENMSVEDFIHVHRVSHEYQKDSDEKNVLNDRSGMTDDQTTANEDSNLPLNDRNHTDDSNEMLEAFKQLLGNSKYMSLSHDPQLQDTTGIVNLEDDAEKSRAEINENDEHNSAGRLDLDDVTTNEPVSSQGDVEPKQLVSDPKPDNEEDLKISTVLPEALLHDSDENALNHHQESPAADLAENSLDDVETDHSVGQDALEGSGIPNLFDSIPIQTKAGTLTEELPGVSEDTSVMYTEVEDIDIDTTGIEVVSSNQKGDDSILVPQRPAEEDSGDRVGMLYGQTSMPGTEDASVLEEVTQTPDPHLHDAQDPRIAELILNLSLVEPVIVDPVIENVSGEEGHHLITSSGDGKSKDKNENRLEVPNKNAHVGDIDSVLLKDWLSSNYEESNSNVIEVVDQEEFSSSDHFKEWHVEADPVDNIGLINITLDLVLDSTILNADTTSNNLLSDKGNDDGERYIVDKASEIEEADSPNEVTEIEGLEPGKIVEVERDHGDQATLPTHAFENKQSSSGPDAKIEMYPDSSELVPPETEIGNEQRQTEILEEADTENMSVEDFIHVHRESHESQKDSDEKNVPNDRSGMTRDQTTAIEDNNLPLDNRNHISSVSSQEVHSKGTKGLYNEITLENERAQELGLQDRETNDGRNSFDQSHAVSQLSPTDEAYDVITQSERTIDHDTLCSGENFLSDSWSNYQEATDVKSTISDEDRQQDFENVDVIEKDDFEKISYRDIESIPNVEREDETSTSHSEPPEKQDMPSDQYSVGPPQEEITDTSVNKGTRSFFENAMDFVIPSTDSKDLEDPEPKGQEEEEQEPPPVLPYLDLHEPEPQSQSTSVEDSLKATAFLKEYKNIQKQISADEITTLLDMFGKHKLLWLDYSLGSSETLTDGQDGNNGRAIISDFERLLQYHIDETKTSSGGVLEDEDQSRKCVPLRKLEILLSNIKNRFTQVKAPVSIKDNQAETDKTNCINDDCFTRNENEDLTNLKGEHFSGEGDIQTPTLTDKYKPEPAVMEYLFSSARQVTGDAVAHILTLKALLKWLTVQVLSSLPDDIRPGPDLYGLPWEAVIVTALLGLGTLLLFSCRFYQCIKSRLYSSKERRMGLKVAELLDEKCKVLETLSEVQQNYEELETALRNSGVLAHVAERENLEVMSQRLKQSNTQLGNDIEKLKEDLNIQRARRLQQEETIADMQETLKTLEEETRDLKSQTEQAQTTLKIFDMNSERNQNNLEAAKEEKVLLQEKNGQLVQEAEGWGERMSELEEEMRMCESSYTGMLQDATNKDERIKSLTDCLLKMKDWDSVLEVGANREERSGKQGTENGEGQDNHQRQRIQKLIHAAKMNADLKSVDEDKDRVFAKLADEVKAKEDLQEGILNLENEKASLQTDSEKYTSQVQKLQQKLQIMTEMYQENELKLHRMLTVEERERLQKDEKLTKADKSITLAVEELNSYRQRAQDLEDELEKTNQAYKTQITSQEKKAHNNWLAARGADRDLAEVKRENAHLRQKLTDTQFKLEVVEKDPYTLDNMDRPLFRGERSPYGPSPLHRPASENRAFLSPPTLMDGPPRLSPNFPPMGPGGRGYMYLDPGLPYRRPLPGALPMGPLPPRGPGPAESHSFGHQPDSSFMGNSMGPGENERDSHLSAPGDLRDMRMGPPLLVPPGMGPLPPIEHRDPYFARKGPYGPPDFFSPRGPAPMGIRGPPPPGMFGRVPPPPPQHSFLPGPPPRPSPPGSEVSSDQSPSPHDVI